MRFRKRDEFRSVDQWQQLRLALGHAIAVGGAVPPSAVDGPSSTQPTERNASAPRARGLEVAGGGLGEFHRCGTGTSRLRSA